MLLLTACGGGGSSPPPPVTPPPPPATATNELASDLAGLTDDLYEISYAALLSRSPETIVWQALEFDFPLNDVVLNNL